MSSLVFSALICVPVFPLLAAEADILVEDTFALQGAREANADLRGQVTEKGDAPWKVLGNLTLSADGAVTAAGEGGSVAIVPIPEPNGVVNVEADVNPAGTGFIALALMEKGDVNFWNDTPVWCSIWPGGRCELRAGNQVLFGADQVPGFRKGELNHLELSYDAAANTAALKLNGEMVAEAAALEAKPTIKFACFRFQEKLKPGMPVLDNFRVSETVVGTGPAPSRKPQGDLPAIPPQGQSLPPSKPLPELVGRPVWNQGEVSNEPVLFVDSGRGPVAKLLFPPEEILSVRSAGFDREFQVGKDLAVTPGSNELTLPAGSTAPFLMEEELFPPASSAMAIKAARGERAEKLGGNRWIRWSENPAAYFSRQLVVTYRHKGDWTGYEPRPEPEVLGRSFAKLKSRVPFKLLVLGDSISAGCFASGNLKCAPFQPSYPRLVSALLKSAYGGEIELVNLSKGGQVAAYALAQIPLIVSQKPDLVVLAFGMNDGSGRVSAESYGKTIAKVIEGVRKDLPGTEFVLVSTIVGNPEWTGSAPDLYPQYREKLKALTGPGVALADVTALSEDVLKTKAYADITVNGVNHPNDFAHRLYGQTILALLGAN